MHKRVSLEQYPYRCRDEIARGFPESDLTLGKWVSAAKDLPSCAPGDSFHRRTPRLPAQGRHFRRLLGLSARVPFPQPRRVRHEGRFRKVPGLGGHLPPQSQWGNGFFCRKGLCVSTKDTWLKSS
ncbi:hypothetical protein TNCT_353351 [Trichonephila clavata]|uniref:Uncharacterized protein n=1 Tax=Trichonephila clavata TaxID=2740835 RepID=A0A8X6FDS3_TRICU|nr:hypothetical protein TNCT_353351 [Trichonephila clavata]